MFQLWFIQFIIDFRMAHMSCIHTNSRIYCIDCLYLLLIYVFFFFVCYKYFPRRLYATCLAIVLKQCQICVTMINWHERWRFFFVLCCIIFCACIVYAYFNFLLLLLLSILLIFNLISANNINMYEICMLYTCSAWRKYCYRLSALYIFDNMELFLFFSSALHLNKYWIVLYFVYEI